MRRNSNEPPCINIGKRSFLCLLTLSYVYEENKKKEKEMYILFLLINIIMLYRLIRFVSKLKSLKLNLDSLST